MDRDWPAYDIAPPDRGSSMIRCIVSAEDGTYRLSETQARAILDLRLQRLTALGRDEIGDELKKLADEIRDYLEILRSRARIMEITATSLPRFGRLTPPRARRRSSSTMPISMTRT